MLFQIYSKKTSVILSTFTFNDLLEDLEKDGYHGTLADLRGKIAELFHVPEQKALASTGNLIGDLFFPAEQKLIYFKCYTQVDEEGTPGGDVFDDPGKSYSAVKLNMETGMISPMGLAETTELDNFSEVVSTILEVKFGAADVKWQEVREAKADRPPVDGKAVITPPESDIELAGVLRDGKLEPLFAVLIENNGELILDQWLEGREDAEEIEYFIDKLFEADFFDEEIIVYNNQDQAVFRAKDRASLEALQAAGIRDVNGNSLDTANVRRMIMLAKEKQEQLSLVWQARIFLIDMLFKVGLANKDILVLDKQDDIEIMLAWYDNEPILFLLSNNSIEAEAFADITSLLKDLKKPAVVAVSKGSVDIDGAQAAGAGSCIAINGIDEFNTKLLDLFSSQRMNAIEAAMTDFNQMISLNVVGMSMARLKAEG